MATPERRDRRDLKDTSERLVNQDNQALVEPEERSETKDQLVLPEKMVLMDQKVNQEASDPLVLLVYQDVQDHQDSAVRRERKELLERLVPKARRETVVATERTENPVFLA